MDIPVVPGSAPTAQTHTPESLRQRQRDRLSPRGRFAKTSRIAESVREIDSTRNHGIMLSAAPKSKGLGNQSSDVAKRKELQKDLRKENSARRARNDLDEVKKDIAPDGGSAGREGRQFTVAKVGNNGKIYLR